MSQAVASSALVLASYLGQRLAGNPHTSPENAEAVEETRNVVLRHFNTDDTKYDVIFTSGATASIKERLEGTSVS